ncbi:MAG: hypothetical protein NTZ44_03690 [Candidatus Nomurabacteria bacterium]|nr:hypothetical protein [Candidatus Nomurabacteria bacterium]
MNYNRDKKDMEHQSESKICQNCKTSFIIEQEDFNFYEKMKVPAPTWCPECRMARRFLFMNTWNLYRRNCEKCGESTLSMFSEDKPHKVFCLPCWWSDDWDGTEYAINYDPSRSFLEQMKELELRTPWMANTMMYTMNVNSPYCNATGPVKNCYMLFWADYCENSFYSSYLNTLKDSIDCYRVAHSELCYEGTGLNKCYRTFFSEECDSCTDTWFSRACSGLVNCFGCINLRNKNYCIFNEQYSQEDYFKKVKEFDLISHTSLEKIKKDVLVFWSKYPRRFYNGNALNKNVSGDYIYESKNAQNCFMVSGAEDCKFTQFVSIPKAKDCYDNTGWGDGSERIYESTVVGLGASNVKFSNECWPNAMNTEYSIYAIGGCKDIFGCVNLKKKQYCILNKQYSKEEYEKLKEKIIKDMNINTFIDSKNRVYKYGDSLPIELSPFSYNESNAGKFLPITKEKALEQGFTWSEGKVNEYKITAKASDLPDTISYTTDEILNDVFECASCQRAYKFTLGELNLMRRLSLPLPHKCFHCRQEFRFSRSNQARLYDRNYMKCGVDLKTSYNPDNTEIVYCEKCYQQEVY